MKTYHDWRALPADNNQTSSANTQGASDEQNTPPQAGAQGQQPGQNQQPTFEQRLASAENDPAALKTLAEEIHGSLKTTRHEAMTRRQSEEALSAELKKFKDADNERKRAEMTDLQKAQEDLKAAQGQLVAFQKELADTKARADFLQAGATDIESVAALWQLLPDDEKAKQKPAEWAAALKAQKGHLFGAVQAAAPTGFGGNHRQDEGGSGNGGGSNVITHPQNQSDINKVWELYDQTFAN